MRAGGAFDRLLDPRRILLCILSIAAACSLFWLLDLGSPAQKILHVWYRGVASFSLLFFTVAVIAVVRGAMAKAGWPILVGLLAGYVSSVLGNVAYWAIFEGDRFFNAVEKITWLENGFILFGMAPLVLGGWLVGAMTGVAFVAGRRVFSPAGACGDKQIKYIIAEGWDVSFYARKEDAESYMEAIDVEDGVYTGYDSDGRLLKIVPWHANSLITLAEEHPGHQQQLIELLTGLLEQRGRKSEGADLPALLAMFSDEVK